MPHKFFEKAFVKPLVNRALKKFAPELRELLMLHLLQKKPAHGYEIIKFFEEGAPADLEAKANRVYPSLEKLKNQGYLELDIDRTASKKKPRKIYSLTDEGRRHLLREIDELRSELDSVKKYVETLEKEIQAPGKTRG